MHRAGAVAPDEDRAELDAAATGRISENLEEYAKLVRSVRLFKEMGDDEVNAAALGSKVRHFKEGEMIYNEGDSGHDCWVVASGVVYALQLIWSVARSNAKEWREMRTYKAGQCFGERGLLRTEPRQARMMCRTDVTCLQIPAEIFVKCARVREGKEDLMRKIDVFETMTDEQLGKLAALLKKQYFTDGQTLTAEGGAGERFYLL